MLIDAARATKTDSAMNAAHKLRRVNEFIPWAGPRSASLQKGRLRPLRAPGHPLGVGPPFYWNRRCKSTPQAVAGPLAAPAATTSIDEPTLAVIWTVLEVERRLNRAESAGRLTIVRSGEPGRSR